MINADFHIHSKYSKGTSPDMELPLIAKQAELKGLDLVGTGDALHTPWRKHIKENFVELANGIYKIKNSELKTKFIVTTEVEDAKRVHHLILFPSIESAENLYDILKKYSSDIDKDGRPHLRINAKETVDFAREVGAMVGPAHAFTPWTSMYKTYDSIKDCYGDNSKHIHFLELGLSADSNMADLIPELSDITFMTNSDCHSPWPHRLGREFNRINIDTNIKNNFSFSFSFPDIKDSIINHKFALNVGLNPKEGKYHLTACTRCFLKFKPEDAIKLKRRCPKCKGIIKKGVDARIYELAKFDKPQHPEHRPPYIHIIPLAEVISMSINVKTLTSKRITEKWNELIKYFGTEINVLIDRNADEIKKIDPKIGQIIDKFRNGRIKYISGGGGMYGRPTLDLNEDDKFWGMGQKSLTEF
ncbi:MAG: TIGR00375 family protein [Candidatus Altiarchaeales archaeon HGW-Altiarchaeales-3]|nr:MAG: TIGR00375 family protein [Candidatus Altiarchaeales archaeon HGW-Altiarchaeales-3]